MKSITVESLSGLPDAAEKIIKEIAGRRIVAFYGPMGAGKTTLIREIASRLNVADNVASPSFALVNHYVTSAGENVYHFDFYRIESVEEAYDMGYEEYFYGTGLCLVEWPEKIEELLPEDTLRVTIIPDPEHDDRRTILVG